MNFVCDLIFEVWNFQPGCFIPVLLLLTSLSPGTSIGSEPKLSLQRIFSKPYIAGSRANGARISPDGNLIIFRWDSSAHDTYRYWMMHSDGSAMHMLPDTLLDEIEWSPDSKTIACTRKGDIFLTDTSFRSFTRVTKTEEHENGLQWSHDGKMLAFTSGKKIAAFPVGLMGVYDLASPIEKDGTLNLVDFTSDNRRIIFTESTNEGLPEFIVPKFTGKEVTTRSFKGGVTKTKFGIAPVDTGKISWIKLPGDERFFSGDIALSPDGKRVVVERFTSNRKRREIFVADTDSGKATLVYEETDKAWVEGGLYSTRWMPDGKQIITTTEKEGWNNLYAMDPDGKHFRRILGGDWEIRWFDIHPSGSSIYLLANKEQHSQWQIYAFDMKTASLTRLSKNDGTYENPSMSKDGSSIVCGYSNFATPTELVKLSTVAASATMLAGASDHSSASPEIQLTHSIPEAFKRIEWVIPEIIHFKSRDGKSIPGMIYKPPDFTPTRKYPVVVFVHGAGYLQNVYRGWSYYYREYMFHHRLAEKGYVVFEVEYRGSAGLGRDFRTDVSMHLGGKDLDDEVDGIEFLKSLGYIDAQRVGVYGGSYGGFMTLMGLFLTQEYACGAALRAVTSWENYYRHNPWYTEARLGKPEDNAEAYKISSPITYADSLKKPLLILHGMVDDNVFFQDAVQLITKLQKAGKKFEVMVYPGEAHSFSEPESWYDEYSRIEEFFDNHLMK